MIISHMAASISNLPVKIISIDDYVRAAIRSLYIIFSLLSV